MRLCCVCGKKLTHGQVRYIGEVGWDGRGDPHPMKRVVCPQHEKEICEGKVPVLKERQNYAV